MLHGIVYDLHVGLLKQLVLQVDGQDKVRALLEADRRWVGGIANLLIGRSRDLVIDVRIC
jgi:hypothetical protein